MVDQDDLLDEIHGSYKEVTSTEINMSYDEWHMVEYAIERKGFNAAYEYDKENNTLYIWGENLDADELWRVVNSIEELEEEYRNNAMDDNARQASRAAGTVSDAITEF